MQAANETGGGGRARDYWPPIFGQELNFRPYESSFIVIAAPEFARYCSPPDVNPAWSCDILISLQRAIELHRDARIGDKGENKTGRHEGDRQTEGGKRERKRRVADGERKASAVRRVDYRFCLPGGPSSSIDIRNPAEPVVELMQKSMNQ